MRRADSPRPPIFFFCRWDKSHTPYFLAFQAGALPNPGPVQNAAVVIQPDWSFSLFNYVASPYDLTSPLWRSYVVPSSYDMSWPHYQIEGIPIGGQFNAALTSNQVNRNDAAPPQPVAPPPPAVSSSSSSTPSAPPTPQPIVPGMLHNLTVTSFVVSAVANGGAACAVTLVLSPPSPGSSIIAYLQASDSKWWSKAWPQSYYATSSGGTAVIANLFSTPLTDAPYKSLAFFAVPGNTNGVPLQAVPVALGTTSVPFIANALGTVLVNRGFVTNPLSLLPTTLIGTASSAATTSMADLAFAALAAAILGLATTGLF